MFSSEKTINSLTDLFADVKDYVLLQKEYVTLDLAEKLTVLFSSIILGFVLMCLTLLVLFYLSFTLIYLMAPIVGGPTVAFAIMTLILLGATIFLYVKRQQFIIGPVTNFVAGVLLPDLKKEEEKDEAE